MENQAVIFDLDGTLLDTIEDIAAAVNRGINRFGFPSLSIEEYKRMVGEGIELLVRRALPPAVQDEAFFQKILEAVRVEYKAGLVEKTRLYPGIAETLDNLTRQGIKMAILSNKPHYLVMASVKALLSRWPFVAIRGAQEDKAHKPDPFLALELAAILDCAPPKILLVGDSEIDILTARNAGMQAVVVTWGFRSRQELSKLSPDALIDTPAQLISLLSS